MSSGDDTITRADLDAELRAERLRIAEAAERTAKEAESTATGFWLHKLAAELRREDTEEKP